MTFPSQAKLNRIQQQSADQKLLDGLTRRQERVSSFTLGNTSFKTADIIASLQARMRAAAAVDSARATWQTAVKAARDERAKTKSIVSGVRQSLLLMFAGSIDTLAEFGLKPHKARGGPTPEQKVAAAAKAKATRTARHTAGPKQKAKIKGTVPSTAPAVPPVATSPGATHDAPTPGAPPRIA